MGAGFILVAFFAETWIGSGGWAVVGGLTIVNGWRCILWGNRKPPFGPKAQATAVAATMPLGFPELPPLARPVTRRAYEGGGSVLADNINTRVFIRYTGSSGEGTERTVLVARVRGTPVTGGYAPDTFNGFCELRQTDRFFMFSRVEAAFDPDTGEEIKDLERHLVNRGEKRVQEIEFNMLTPEEELEISRIEAWLQVNGNRGMRHFLPPIVVTLEARDPAGTIAKFLLAIETAEQYGGRPYVVGGAGKRIEKGARRRAMEFTLPGFHTPEWEIISLVPEGSTEVVTDVIDWVNRQGRTKKAHRAAMKRAPE
jgi:hypothetical protein